MFEITLNIVMRAMAERFGASNLSSAGSFIGVWVRILVMTIVFEKSLQSSPGLYTPKGAGKG